MKMKLHVLAMSVALLSAAGVSAQVADPNAPAAVQVTAAPPPPAPVPTGPSMSAVGQSLDATTQEQIQLARQLELEQARTALLTSQAEGTKIRKEALGTTSGTSDLPQLVGLISRLSGGVIAEFLVGDAIMQVRVGDWVSAQWKLDKVLSNGVELISKSGKQRYTLLFGGSSSKGSNGGASVRPVAGGAY